MALCSFSTYAQVKTVSGTITDEVGFPLPGANVFEAGTQNGVTTDFDGNYYLVVRGGCWLDDARACRSAYRFRAMPKNTYRLIGFRVVCDIKE